MAKSKKKKGGGLASFLVSTPTLAITAGLFGGAKALAPLIKQVSAATKAGKYIGKGKELRALKLKHYPSVFLTNAAVSAGATGLTAHIFKKLHLKSLAERGGNLKKHELDALKKIKINA